MTQAGIAAEFSMMQHIGRGTMQAVAFIFTDTINRRLNAFSPRGTGYRITEDSVRHRNPAESEIQLSLSTVDGSY